MELEPSPGHFQPIIDRRPIIPEPLPVRLIAIEDVRLPAASGMEPELDAFYVKILGFERQSVDEGAIVYRAENLRLHFELIEPPITRDSMRSIGIEVPNLTAIEHQLIDREIEYTRQRGITPGQEALVLQEPAGSWISIGEYRLVS